MNPRKICLLFSPFDRCPICTHTYRGKCYYAWCCVCDKYWDWDYLEKYAWKEKTKAQIQAEKENRFWMEKSG